MLRPNPVVIATDLEENLVLLHSQTREMFTLNATGRLVWQHIEEGLDTVVARVVEQFEVEQTRAEADVWALVEGLKARGLLVEEEMALR
jgi:hypothetical protein